MLINCLKICRQIKYSPCKFYVENLKWSFVGIGTAMELSWLKIDNSDSMFL